MSASACVRILSVLLVVSFSVTGFAATVPLREGGTDAAPDWTVLSSTDDALRLRFTLPALNAHDLTLDGETWRVLSIDGGVIHGEDGAPGLPSIGRLVAVPEGATVSARVIGHETTTLEDLRLLPNQPAEAEAFAIDRGAYAEPGYRTLALADPATPLIELGAPQHIAGGTMVALSVAPVAYDPVARRATVAHTIDIELTFTGGTASAAPIAPWLANAVTTSGPRPVPEPPALGSWACVLRGEPEILEQIEPLLEWRRRQGYHVAVIDVNEVGNAVPTILPALRNVYNDPDLPPLEFVLMVGDVDGQWGVATGQETMTTYAGTGDHPLANMSGGEIAECHIGRLSFRSPEQLGVIVDKILGYELSPPMDDTSWYRRAGLAGDPYDSGITTVYVNQWLKNELLHSGWAEVDTLFTGDFVGGMMGMINSGINVFGYRGYYGLSGLSQSYINYLSNGGRLPVALMPTCDTGTLTFETCHSEAFQRAPNGGAIAAVGTSTTGTHTRYNNSYYQGFWDGLINGDDHRVGVAHSIGKLELHTNYDASEPDVARIWSIWNSLLADPATDIWTGVPQAIEVVHDESLPAGATVVPVFVRRAGGVPAQGVTVCAYREGEVQVSAATDERGRVELRVPPLTDGRLLITASGHNRLPYRGDLIVGAGKVHCALAGAEVGDDGVASAAETVELTITALNDGAFELDDVTAELIALEGPATVVDADLAFGGLAVDAQGQDIATISVDPDARDGRTVRVDLVFRSGAREWPAAFEFAVSAPAFVPGFESWTGGGFVIDPGESGDLALNLENVGSGGATGVTVAVTSLCPWLTIDPGPGDFGDLPPGATGDNAATPYPVDCSRAVFPGQLGLLELTVATAEGATQTLEFTTLVGAVHEAAPLGPDAHGYFAIDDMDASTGQAPEYDWATIAPPGGGGVVVHLDDHGWQQDDIATVSLPFTFRYYGVDYDEISVCSNGYLMPGRSTLVPYTNRALASAGALTPMIAPFWDNLYAPSGAGVYMRYYPSLHYVVFQWDRMRNAASGVDQTFQVILYDPAHHPTSTGDGKILFQYESVENYDPRDAYATVGLQSHDRDVSLLYSFWNVYPSRAAELEPGRAILFTPVEPPLGSDPVIGPAVLDMEVSSGGTGSTTLQIANAGSDATEMEFEIVAVDPEVIGWSPPHSSAPDKNITGSELFFDTPYYHTEGTYTIVMTVRAEAVDQEPVAMARLYMAPGVTLVSAGDIVGDTGVLSWDGTAGDDVITAWGGGTLQAGDEGYCVLEFEFDPGLPDQAGFVWWVDGDGSGYPPNYVSGGIVLTPAPPTVRLHTPDDGDVVYIGRVEEVDVEGLYGADTAHMEIQREPDGPWARLADNVSLTFGSWQWLVDGDPGPYARLRAVLPDDPAMTDESGAFIMSRPLDWLTVETLNGTVTGGDQLDVMLNVDAAELADGVHEALLRVETDAGVTVDVLLNLTVGDPDLTSPPSQAALHAAHPNPFNPSTLIRFDLPTATRTSLAIYDLAGARVAVLIDELMPAGRHERTWLGRDDRGRSLPSGLYICRLEAGAVRESQRLLLVR